MNNTKSVMLVGVGGQGSLLASKILGSVLLKKGYDVKVSEVHGMSQRGGSVVTYVKFGEKVYSPIVCENEADFILAFEKLEAIRWLSYLKKDGKIIVNMQQINPMPVIVGLCEYPLNIEQTIKQKSSDAICLDALSLAKQAGNVKAVNIVLLGVLAKYINIDKNDFINSINELVPEKFLDVNLKAFELGYENS